MENGVNYEYVGGIMKSYDGLVLNIKGSEYKIELSEYTDINKHSYIEVKGIYGLSIKNSNNVSKCICTIYEFESSIKKDVISYINKAIKYRIDNMSSKKRYFTRHLENIRKEVDIELSLLLKDSDVEINRSN